MYVPVELLSVVRVVVDFEWSRDDEAINLLFFAAKSDSWSDRILDCRLNFFVSEPLALLLSNDVRLLSVFAQLLQRISEVTSFIAAKEFTLEEGGCASEKLLPLWFSFLSPFLDSLHFTILLWLSGYVRLHWPSKSSTRSSSISSSSE